MKQKILLLDIETSFMQAAVFGRWKQDINMNQILEKDYMLCWSAKWLGENEKMRSGALYRAKSRKKFLKDLWDLIDEANYIVAHNGDNFDLKKIRTYFIQNDLPPPSPFKTIDTLKIARRLFSFPSNRLGDLAEFLGIKMQKTDVGGIKFWIDVVIRKDAKKARAMSKYCDQDVRVLEQVFQALRAWDNKNPVPSISAKHCAACGSTNVKKNGQGLNGTTTIQRVRCKDCGHNMRLLKKAEVLKSA